MIDVLFYGALNKRRRQVLDAIQQVGLKLVLLPGMYGAERDYMIARSRLILNVHFYSPATLEIPRLGYLWGNCKCIVSERAPETEVPDGLEEVCAYCAHEDIIGTVTRLVRNKAERNAQAERGFDAFTRHGQEDYLEALVGRKSYKSAVVPLPRSLHVGSGKDFRPESLNIDINPNMNPDVVLDFSKPLDATREYYTERFGTIRLMPGSFKRITAFNVLEHVRVLPQCMSNFLDLLKLDGVLEVSVPYDLSLGAWQDPTHLRGFNEMSWIYYCEWAWYLGWRYTRFEQQSVDYVLSGLGKALQEHGYSMENLKRLPRTIDSMHVLLRKRKSTEHERTEYSRLTREYYNKAVGNWLV